MHGLAGAQQKLYKQQLSINSTGPPGMSGVSSAPHTWAFEEEVVCHVRHGGVLPVVLAALVAEPRCWWQSQGLVSGGGGRCEAILAGLAAIQLWCNCLKMLVLRTHTGVYYTAPGHELFELLRLGSDTSTFSKSVHPRHRLNL
eukprot:1149920-Pelagomonas_calceolata.AAC.8